MALQPDLVTPRVVFWLFVGLHLWKVVQTFLYAEDLERAKRGNIDVVRPWRGFAKVLFTAALYLAGFYYARLPYLWLLLAIAAVVSGFFGLTIATAMRRAGVSGATLVPEYEIPARSARRRLAAAVQIVLVVLWVYAWREVVTPLWPN